MKSTNYFGAKPRHVAASPRMASGADEAAARRRPSNEKEHDGDRLDGT
jgi:hypothetical protein